MKLTMAVEHVGDQVRLRCLVFPECVGRGRTLDEAIEDVRRAIYEHLDRLNARVVPPPGAEVHTVTI